jgi:hypothetical protein
MVLLLLTGGAIINVAVAWGLAIWARPVAYPVWTKDYTMLSNMEAADFLTQRFSENAPIDRTKIRGMRTVALGRTQTEYGLQPTGELYVKKMDFGIPRRSMSMEWSGPYENLVPHYLCAAPRCIPWTRGYPYLPLNALWPGFAINTIFYAAILWLLFAAPGFVRRRLRVRRGQCPACAYPVGASDVCTECGRPVKQKATCNRQKAIA